MLIVLSKNVEKVKILLCPSTITEDRVAKERKQRTRSTTETFTYSLIYEIAFNGNLKNNILELVSIDNAFRTTLEKQHKKKMNVHLILRRKLKNNRKIITLRS